jgi:tripartite-type tricarboxylate transporter receptor subunit TctC
VVAKTNGAWRILALLGAVIALLVLLPGCTQETAAPKNWPAQDITLIVPFKPGGGYDLQARIIAPFLEKNLPLKVNVIIKNIDGAGGKMGAVELSKSKPDGYTIGIVGREAVAFMGANSELELDPSTWSWLGQVSGDPLVVAIPTAGKYKTLADMKGQDIRFGVTSEMLPSAVVMGQALGMKPRPILFSGSGDAILAAMRGDLDAVTFSFPTMMKGVADSQGKLTALYVSADKRLDSAKDVPTLAELGVKLDASSASVVATSRVLVGPPNMDKAIKTLWETAIAKSMKDPDFLAQMAKAVQYPNYADAAAAAASLKSAEAAYKPIMDLLKPFLTQ